MSSNQQTTSALPSYQTRLLSSPTAHHSTGSPSRPISAGHPSSLTSASSFNGTSLSRSTSILSHSSSHKRVNTLGGGVLTAAALSSSSNSESVNPGSATGWTRGHRSSASSLSSLRGKWEERALNKPESPSVVHTTTNAYTPYRSSSPTKIGSASPTKIITSPTKLTTSPTKTSFASPPQPPQYQSPYSPYTPTHVRSTPPPPLSVNTSTLNKSNSTSTPVCVPRHAKKNSFNTPTLASPLVFSSPLATNGTTGNVNNAASAAVVGGTREIIKDGDAVIGMKTRRHLPLVSSSSTSSSKSTYLPPQAIDKTRHHLQAEEYLTHVAEALQWVQMIFDADPEGAEDVLKGVGVVEFEKSLRDGVVLALVAKKIGKVPGKIFRMEGHNLNHQYRHTDNINVFLSWIKGSTVGLPDNFIFETFDLYNMKNLPKVIFCIHALSHLLARLGLLEKISNLSGKLAFTTEQLSSTAKDLTGKSMPNFKGIGKDLAKELKIEEESIEEEEEVVETKEELRARLVEESRSIFQDFFSLARGAVVRRRMKTIQLARPPLEAFVSVAQGALVRKQLQLQQSSISRLQSVTVSFQSFARGRAVREGVSRQQHYLQQCEHSIVSFQSKARGKLQRKKYNQLIVGLCDDHLLDMLEDFVARCQGYLVRSTMQNHRSAITTTSSIISRFGAVARGKLIRNEMQKQRDNVTGVTSFIVDFQAAARAKLVRARHEELRKALSNAQVLTSFVGAQTGFRAALSRSRKNEQKKEVEFVLPNFVGLQAAARRALIKTSYESWRNHIHDNEPIVLNIQSFLRGIAARSVLNRRLRPYWDRPDLVTKVQAVWRGKDPREGWEQIKTGTNVKVSTIRTFGHLLDQTPAQIEDEIRLEKLRRKVVVTFRATQDLEVEENKLKNNIGLLVQNVASVQNSASNAATTRKRTTDYSPEDSFADLFTSRSLTKEAQRKYELYQDLLYQLQTNPQYLAGLVANTRLDKTADKTVQSFVQSLFGYGQQSEGSREDYWSLSFFSHAIRAEINTFRDPFQLKNESSLTLRIASKFLMGSCAHYFKKAFGSILTTIVNDEHLDLNCDPREIYKRVLGDREAASGNHRSNTPAPAWKRCIEDGDTRNEFIHKVSVLSDVAKAFVSEITKSVISMPYLMKYLSREIKVALQERFPGVSEQIISELLGHFIWHICFRPAFIAPEQYQLTVGIITPKARSNLEEISKVISRFVTAKEYHEDEYFYALNSVLAHPEVVHFRDNWFDRVANVPDVKEQYGLDDYLDVTTEPQPINIAPGQVFSIQSLLAMYLDGIAPQQLDPVRVILNELGGPPTSAKGSGREEPVDIPLNFRTLAIEDPDRQFKTEWALAKKLVLAVLKVQPEKDVLAALIADVTDEHCDLWEDLVDKERTEEQAQRGHSRVPTQGPENDYMLNDIKLLSFDDVKEQALTICLALQEQGVLTQADRYQAILNSIALDIKIKNKRQIRRTKNIQDGEETLRHLEAKQQRLKETIDTYHEFAKTSMNNVQTKGNKRGSVNIMSKQFWHERQLKNKNQMPTYGSFLYSADVLYSRGILLSISAFSPQQFKDMEVSISSDVPGTIDFEILFTPPGGEKAVVGRANVIMQDLLQRQADRQNGVKIGPADYNVPNLIEQLNKNKFGAVTLAY